ncbi:MAG: acyl carrier protein [Ilumatobacteraceae bacterium]
MSASRPDSRPGDVLDRIAAVVTSASAQPVALPPTSADLPLRSLGLDSSSFIAVMSGIEEEFGIEWDDDVPSSTFDSLQSVASYLATRFGVGT